MTNQCDEKCGIYVCGSLFTILSFVLLEMVLYLPTMNTYNEYDCYIESVSYPIGVNYPNHNFGNCNCGKKCTSNLGTRIGIKGRKTDSKIIVMFQKNTIPSTNDGSEWTFVEKKCLDGENINDRINAVKYAQLRAQYYINIMNKSETIKCWNNDKDDDIYLNNDIDLKMIYIISSFVVVSFLFFIGFLIYWQCKKIKNKREILKEINNTKL